MENSSAAKHVMIVDDDPVIRALLEDCFSAAGYKVQTLDSGVKCLEALSQDGAPDMLLLDNQMPLVTGLEVLKKIRNDAALKDTLVIMLSANEETKEMAAQQGADADMHILKPFEMKFVLNAVKAMIG